jgi:hypothetical protein
MIDFLLQVCGATGRSKECDCWLRGQRVRIDWYLGDVQPYDAERESSKYRMS